MTKKDFILIAAVLKEKRPISDNFMFGDYNNSLRMWNIIVEGLSHELKYNNPLFNVDKFYSACGYGE